MTFTVTINPCIVTSVAVSSNPFDPLQTHLVYVRDTVGLLIALASFSQTPACDYTPSNTLLADSIPSTGFLTYPFLNFYDSTTLKIQTNDMTLQHKNFTIK